MVYESGFSTRRTYSSRPIVSSYTVTIPTVERVSRVYKTSFPIYSTYSIPKRIVTGGTRVITSPVRVITSPPRVISRVLRAPSPVRVIRTTTRVVTSPERTTSYSYSSPSTYHLPTSYYIPTTTYNLPTTYRSSYLPTSYSYTRPTSYIYSPVNISRAYSRSLSPVRITRTPISTLSARLSPVRLSPVRVSPVRTSPVRTSPVRRSPSHLKSLAPPGYGDRALTNYLKTEPFQTFEEEANRIRVRAHSIQRELAAPVENKKRSQTPFPIWTGYEPSTTLTLDSYINRVTNPSRHIAREVHRMSHYAEPARKYVGKSHLASVRITGGKAYNIRKPMYDSEKVNTDINLMSWYLRNPRGKSVKKTANNDAVQNGRKVEAVQVEA